MGVAPNPAAPPVVFAKEKTVRYPRPEHVRGLYMTAWVAGGKDLRAGLLKIIQDTELNAAVIDIRDDGMNYWETGIPLSTESGATHLAVPRPDELMALLEAEKVYPIARIACFVDSELSVFEPGRAVQDRKGKVWIERNGRRWLDPYNKENWEYIGQIVDFAIKQGFPEIQLDYVRMPGGGRKSSMVFPAKEQWPLETTESEVIQQFAQFVRDRIPRDVVLSADIFGIVSSSTTKDQGIGQDMAFFPQPFDILCPMVYPNHFAKGEYKVADPTSNPHLIVYKSIKDYVTTLPNKPLRPWLQAFDGYGVAEVREQIRALKENGVQEYLLWNPRNKYDGVVPSDTSDLDSPRSAGL